MNGILVIGIFSAAFAIVAIACMTMKLICLIARAIAHKVQHEMMMCPKTRYYM